MPIPTRRLAGIAASITGLLALGVAFAPAASAQAPGNEDNITICHRTNSNGNPYVEITTDPSGQNGGTDHFFEHEGPLWDPGLKAQGVEWGDVIPPSDAHPEGSQAYQELIESGVTFEDFLANGCEAPDAPEIPTFDVTLDKVLGANAPANDPSFTFTVNCESGTVPVSPLTVEASDDPVVVAEDVAQDDTCTIEETDDAGASAVTYEVTGGTAEATGSSVTFSVEAAVAVVATNDFPAPVVVTDACPGLVGDQAPGTSCDQPLVLGDTVVPTPTAAPAAQVAGVQLDRELARTGRMDDVLALLGAGLLVLGFGLTTFGGRRIEF